MVINFQLAVLAKEIELAVVWLELDQLGLVEQG